MSGVSLHQFLTIYAWFGLTALLFLLALIARFYERLSGKRTYYQLFSIPVISFGVAAGRFASLDRVTGDMWGNGLMLLGGLTLAALCLHVYRLMTKR